MKTIYWFLILVVLLVIVGIYMFKPSYHEFKTINSPDNKYSLKIFVMSKNYTLSMKSEADYKKAYVELIDNKGNSLNPTNPIFRKTFSIGDLNVEWLPEEKKVYYTKFDFLTLE
jgi:hypothetical protein